MASNYFESEFDWFLPTPPKKILSITIPDEKNFNLNAKLCESIPKFIKIGVNSDGTMLGLLEDIKGFGVPKNGRIKAESLIERITERGIRLPARYLVENMDGIWIAKLVPPTPIPAIPKKTPKKPRLNGLKAMLPKKELMR
ncbi:hypothetical protein LBW89_04435 [Paenibacillus sp. alder61]|uniref:hypothetical protein n=1 Tax=Paenibacillus sp. alder61 TaxID=2862948 RepID=UPI001CD782D5|nr:hypothetical protein [Paenibacillus sp. alder61]MCA1292267.1 hypothetical protein [Paenibacillus sp. alder61]